MKSFAWSLVALLVGAPLTAQARTRVDSAAVRVFVTTTTGRDTVVRRDTVLVRDTVVRMTHDTTVVHDTVASVVHDTIATHDTITLHDTVLVVKRDTVFVHDTITVHDSAVTKPPIIPPPSGSFLPPNILNTSFDKDWGGFTNWTGVGTPQGVTREQAADGTWSVNRSWGPTPDGDGGSQFLYHIGATDRVWVRFYFKATSSISSIMKFARLYDTNFGVAMGGFFMGEDDKIFSFGTDQENGAITTWFGLAQSQVLDGKWHSLELDYWRNGDPSGFPSEAFYFDGAPVSMPDGRDVQYPTAGNSSYWKAGRLYAGERKNSLKLGYIEWLATLNQGNTTTGQVNINRVAISTLGRIGP